MIHLPITSKRFSYPSELYEYLVRKANAAINDRFIEALFPQIYITFREDKRKSSWHTVDWLFEKITKSIARIREKYNVLPDDKGYVKELRVDLQVEKTFRRIIINAYHVIPVNSFGKLLNMILWSYIVFAYNTKPSESEELQQIVQKYQKNFKLFLEHWNKLPREKIPLPFPTSCAVCGKPAEMLNKWTFKTRDADEVVYTPVCEKHKMRLI